MARKVTLAAAAWCVLAVLTGCGKVADGGWVRLDAGSDRADGTVVLQGGALTTCLLPDTERSDWSDFELETDVTVQGPVQANLYFHVQGPDRLDRAPAVRIVNFDNQFDATGSLIGLRHVYKRPARPGEFRLNVLARGKRVQVRVDGALVVDYVEPANTTPDRPGRRIARGPFVICSSGAGQAVLGDLRVRVPQPLPPTGLAPALDPALQQPVFDDLDWRVLELLESGYPVQDSHVHLKGGLTLDEALAHSRRTGIALGIAVNCGIGFPVTNDKAAEAFLESMKGVPAFIAMQAEGREWPTLFSRQTMKKFDYVFTDGMTIVDHRGKRARLWIKDEVVIPDKQAFMERLVKTIVDILNNEPIDLYVNPTYLPEVLAGDYDQLWTKERMQRVVDAAARNRIAVEINAKLRLPKPEFIKMAKAAGVKFSFGTNNGGRDLGRLEYAIRMIRECGLTPNDFWMPQQQGTGTRD